MNRACFLDRDGVINRAYIRDGKPYPPDSVDEFEFLPGVKEALEILRNRGFYIIIVTNQPDVETKKGYRDVVETIHEKIRKELFVDDIYVCYDRKGAWYKPKPGMLLAAAEKYQLDLKRSYMIGDRWRDIDAGKAAGCYTLFIDCNYDEKLVERPDFICSDLLTGTKHILEHA